MRIVHGTIVLVFVCGGISLPAFAEQYDLRGDILIRPPILPGKQKSVLPSDYQGRIQFDIRMTAELSINSSTNVNPVFRRDVVPVSGNGGWANRATLPSGSEANIKFEVESRSMVLTEHNEFSEYVHYPDVPSRVLGPASPAAPDRIMITFMHPKRAMQKKRYQAQNEMKKILVRRRIVENGREKFVEVISAETSDEDISKIADAFDDALAFYEDGETYYQKGDFLEKAKRYTSAATAFSTASSCLEESGGRHTPTDARNRQLQCLGNHAAEESTPAERVSRSKVVLDAIYARSDKEISEFNRTNQRYWIDALNHVSGARSKWHAFGEKVANDEYLLSSWNRLYYTSFKRTEIPPSVTQADIANGAIELEGYLLGKG